MYLIHAQLVPESGNELPANTAEAVMRCAWPEDRLEHVEVHPDAPSGPVLGLFLLGESLQEAENAAGALCSRALAADRDLNGFRMAACQAVMPAAYYERLLRETYEVGQNDS